ncbi:MAG: hypothetical protein ACQERX_04820 [Bacillota bacterium]
MNNKSNIDEIIKELAKYGYDMFVNDNIITVLYDGYVKTTPLDNILNLLNDELMKMTINDVAVLLINQHKTRKEIDDGMYDNAPDITPEEIHNFLSKIFMKAEINNIINDQNKLN